MRNEFKNACLDSAEAAGLKAEKSMNSEPKLKTV
jgi:hypothetical protein